MYWLIYWAESDKLKKFVQKAWPVFVMRRGRPTLASKDATPGAKATTPPVVDLTKPGKRAQCSNGLIRIREFSLINPPKTRHPIGIVEMKRKAEAAKIREILSFHQLFSFSANVSGKKYFFVVCLRKKGVVDLFWETAIVIVVLWQTFQSIFHDQYRYGTCKKRQKGGTA
jgi:hypothetical protein